MLNRDKRNRERRKSNREKQDSGECVGRSEYPEMKERLIGQTYYCSGKSESEARGRGRGYLRIVLRMAKVEREERGI